MCDVKSTGSFGAEKTAGVQTSKHEVDVVSDQRKCKQSSTRSTLVSDQRKANSSHPAFAGERPADAGESLYGPTVVTPVNSAC